MKFESSLNTLPVVVFFQDEARFGRISREMAYWVRADMVPRVARQMIREYIYAHCAISPQTGDCFSIITPCCNTEAMNEYLKLLGNKLEHYFIIQSTITSFQRINPTPKILIVPSSPCCTKSCLYKNSP